MNNQPKDLGTPIGATSCRAQSELAGASRGDRSVAVPLADAECERARQRRDELRAAGRCINGPLVGDVGRFGRAHGPPVLGGKCQACVETWRRTR